MEDDLNIIFNRRRPQILIFILVNGRPPQHSFEWKTFFYEWKTTFFLQMQDDL
jgi:hypothetical protein